MVVWVKYNLNIRDSLIVFRIDQQIKEYNRNKIYREEANHILKRVLNRKTVKDILEEYFNIMKNGKLSVLISDEEREIVNLLVNYEGVPQKKQLLYQTYYYLQQYLQKLDAISLYLSVENETINKNDCITPADEELLEEINHAIKKTNREIYALRKNGFFKNLRPSFRKYCDYYNEYLEQYGVSFFADDCCQESRAVEKQRLAEDYDVYLSYLNKVSDEIKLIDAEKVVVYFFNMDDSMESVPAEVTEYIDFSILTLDERKCLLSSLYDEDDFDDVSEEVYYRDLLYDIEDLDEFLIMSKKEDEVTIERYYKQCVDEEDYVKHRLKKRSQIIDEILNEKKQISKKRDGFI